MEHIADSQCMVYLPTFGYIRSEFCQNLIRSCAEKLWKADSEGLQLMNFSTTTVLSIFMPPLNVTGRLPSNLRFQNEMPCVGLPDGWWWLITNMFSSHYDYVEDVAFVQNDWQVVRSWSNPVPWTWFSMAHGGLNLNLKSRKKHDGLFSEKPLAQCTDSLWNWGHENKSSARATFGALLLPCCHCVTNPRCETCRNILYHHHCLSTCSLALQFLMLNVGKYTIHWVFGYGHYACLLHFAAASLYRVFQDSLGSISIEDLAPQHCSVLGSAPGVFVSSKGTFIGGQTKRVCPKKEGNQQKNIRTSPWFFWSNLSTWTVWW